jgi:uncharacterized protein (DUF39 family)
VSVRFRTGTWAFLGCAVQGVLAEGTRVDLAPAATLMVLANAETVIPDLVQGAL